jgi:surfactin synthase thioesterase subunit/acyl carrier protein
VRVQALACRVGEWAGERGQLSSHWLRAAGAPAGVLLHCVEHRVAVFDSLDDSMSICHTPLAPSGDFGNGGSLSQLEEVEGMVCELVKDVVGSEVLPDELLMESGLDSLMAVDLASLLSSSFGTQVPTSVLAECTTISSLALYIDNEKNAARQHMDFRTDYQHKSGVEPAQLDKNHHSFVMLDMVEGDERATAIDSVRVVPSSRFKLTVFVVGGLGSSVNPFCRLLSKFVPLNMTICGIELPGKNFVDSRGSDSGLTSIEEMSEYVVGKIMDFRSKHAAPYVLMGVSFGATVAYEAMTKIQELHIESPKAFIPYAGHPRALEWIKQHEDAGKLFNDILGDRKKATKEYVSNILSHDRNDFLKAFEENLPSNANTWPQAIRATAADMVALISYEYKPRKLESVVCAVGFSEDEVVPEYFFREWEELSSISDTKFLEFNGSHVSSIYSEKNCGTLAIILCQYLF